MYNVYDLIKFLQDTLSGFKDFEGTVSGFENIDNILNHPEQYQLGHISGDMDAWVKSDRLIFSFDRDCHWVFSPITENNITHSCKFINGHWQ